MKQFALITLALLMAAGCSVDDSKIYQSKAFTLYPDRVEQGDFEARAVDATHIVSDYKSPASTNYSSTISFKFAVNGKDNEAPSGQDHRLTIVPENGSYTSPVITFGEEDPEDFENEDAAPNLPPNTEFTVRVDMNPVLKQFEEQGFFTSFDGNKIYKSDFDGVYIAGGSEPLSWDFDNLHNNPSYKLSDEDGDGIYTATYTLNPHDPGEQAVREWKLSNDITQYPSYKSEQLLVDALYNMALDETKMLIEEDSTFRTGAKWAGVWTRDISYSVLLSLGLIEPEIARKSLMRKVKRNRIIQDTGSGGAWPVSSDRVVWTLAAWELYKVTGDEVWLKQTYQIVKNSLEDDLATVYDEQHGLFRGESSFLDWREQSYPKWMDNVDISQSMNLGTNAVYYRTFDIMRRMAELLDRPDDAAFFSEQAASIHKSMDEHLWNDERGFYNHYLYGRHFMNASKRSETLGEALTVLNDIAGPERARRIITEMPVEPFGTPSFYPHIPDIPPYHNNGIWPFVQAYWNWAAAQTGNERALTYGLAALYRPAALFLTNKENFVAGNGDFKGTQINSDRQLWSVAGNLAMVYRVLLGIELKADRMVLDPTIPGAFGGTKRVENFRYRNAVLDFEVRGYGDGIASMMIDGKKVRNHEIPADLKGEHTVQIVMNGQFQYEGGYNLVKNRYSPSAPRAEFVGDTLRWSAVEGAVEYEVYNDGQMVKALSGNELVLVDTEVGQYKVAAVGKNGWKSFTSEPVGHYPSAGEKIIELEKYHHPTDRKLVDYTGSGAVEITKSQNTHLEIPFEVEEGGSHLVTFRYSNGSGPWNTDNKCAIRTLEFDGKKAGTVVMAQRGDDEWSNWGETNPIRIEVEAGSHRLTLKWESSNQNMNGEVNRAVLDHLRMVKISD